MSLNHFGKVTYTSKYADSVKIAHSTNRFGPTITELLWLKVDDIDGHIKHLEKMLIPVIEENQLLQRRLEALEKNDPRVVSR